MIHTCVRRGQNKKITEKLYFHAKSNLSFLNDEKTNKSIAKAMQLAQFQPKTVSILSVLKILQRPFLRKTRSLSAPARFMAK